MKIDRVEVLVTDLPSRIQRLGSSGPYDTGAMGSLLGKPVLVRIFTDGVVGLGQIRPIAPSHFLPDTGAGTWLLPRIVGLQPALRLLYTGAMIDADEALRLGYVTEVVLSDHLMRKTMEIARTIAAGSPHSLGLIKQLVHQGLTAPVSEHMERHTSAMAACFKSDDHREGVASFLERRPANFTGR